MKYYRKHLWFKFSVIITLIILLLSGCVVNNKQDSSLGTTESSGSDFISYCAKEETADNRVYFNYPQFKETTPNADQLNELIVGFIKNALQICDGGGGFKGDLKSSPGNWKWNNDEYKILALDVNYDITRNDSDYLSITFEGDFNHKCLPHPTHYFNALIIDLKKHELVSLPDLYNINTDFINILRKEFSRQIILTPKFANESTSEKKMLQESLDNYSDGYLRKLLGSGDAYPVMYQRTFLTSDMVGISMPLPYAMGDHFEVMLSYASLSSFEK